MKYDIITIEELNLLIINSVLKRMPFKSKAQQKYMFAKHPKIAKKWAKETPSIKRLPKKVKRKK